MVFTEAGGWGNIGDAEMDLLSDSAVQTSGLGRICLQDKHRIRIDDIPQFR